MTNRWPLARSSAALVLANVRYWSSVAPHVRAQLAHWELRARAIGDPELRALALGKLRDERFNALLAATLATLAPRSQRARVVEAIVAMQVLYDYSDVLSEQSHFDEDASARLFTAFTDAVAPSPNSSGEYYATQPAFADGGYLQALVATVRGALATLPATGSIADVAQRSAARCAEAQILNHQASRSGIEEARSWATLQADGTGLGWQEFLAGASASVLAIGALIAAAATPGTTPQDAEQIDALYLSIGALTMLDSVVDLQEDIAAGQLGYLQYYDDPGVLAQRLASVARDGVTRARGLPNGSHHIVTLAGIVAYYASAPTASSDFARPLIAPVRKELAPLIAPTLALMRAWRAAKRVRR
jgi:tetraprenyl-beta-curcumene synthase